MAKSDFSFKMSAERIANTDTNMRNMDAWSVRITNPRGQRMQRQYFMGHGHDGARPTVEMVMESLVADAACYKACEGTPATFMRDYGYEEYSHALKAYKACQRTSDRLDTFLTAEERQKFADQ